MNLLIEIENICESGVTSNYSYIRFVAIDVPLATARQCCLDRVNHLVGKNKIVSVQEVEGMIFEVKRSEQPADLARQG